MMNTAILRAKEITLRYGNRLILNEIDLSLPAKSIIGLVGINGSGKSSLLKIISGEIDFDEGEIIKSKAVTMQYVPQEYYAEPGQKIEHFLSNHSYNQEQQRLYDERLKEYGQYFSLPPSNTLIENLSGGQKRQLLLYRCFSQRPDILLLDEPTNHLDLKSMISIQKLFKEYTGTVLMISHDRFFLDSTVDSIWELDEGKLFTHPGNYSHFLKRKQKRREDQQNMYLKLKQELKREHEWFISGVRARGTKDTGRMNRYFDLKRQVQLIKPRWKELKLPIPKPVPLGNKIMNIEELDVPFPHNKTLIAEDLNFKFEPGMRVGLLGPNGSGKTTLLKSLLGKHKKSGGKISIGQNTEFNYHDQGRNELNPRHTIHYTISENNTELQFGLRKINIYAYLKKFLFTSHDLKKYVSDLSGGEKARLLLAKILKDGGNFLVMDEPTNDLDLDTIQALENTLLSFDGCVLLVSHDRFFLDTICTHIIALEGDGTYTISTGGYTRYINHYKSEDDFWKGKEKKVDEGSKTPEREIEIKITKDPLPVKNKLNSKEIRQIKAELRLLETQISGIEERIRKMNVKINQPDFYTQSSEKIVREHKNLTSLQEDLARYEQKWLDLSEKIT